jgi:serine/threonine-protein kinase
VSFTYELPEGQQFNVPFPLAISPDGSQFVYGTTGGLYLRSMNGLDARHIAGTDKNSALPFFSPDGRWVGYFSQADRKLKKVAVSGGPPVVICDTAISVSAPRWGKDNSIVYSDVLSGGIMRISAGGGSPECLIKVDRAKAMETGTPDHPQILPDGKTVLLTNSFGDPNIATQILAQSLESGERKVLIKGGNSASYLPTGHLVYVFGIDDIAGISAVPFDIHKLEVTGEPTPVLEGQVMSAVSDSGTLVYIPGRLSARAANQYTLVWVDQKGNEVPIAAPANDYRYPRISPDGTKVATSIFADAKRDIWIWDLVRETPMRLTFDGVSACPLWSPDGNRIAFDSTREKAICWKAANGTGGDEKLGSITGQGLFSPWSLSGDGKTLVTLSRDMATNLDIGVMSIEGDRKWKPLLNQKYDETAVTISPDGHWMAYESNESGQYEIYVRPFPEVNAGKWPISTKGGRAPLWSPDGRKLFYRNGDAAMAVAIEPGPAFKPGKSEVLFRGPYVPRTGQEPHPWDISRDGRFLMMKRVQPTEKAPAAKAPRKISIVVNWFEELKQRVPVK